MSPLSVLQVYFEWKKVSCTIFLSTSHGLYIEDLMLTIAALVYSALQHVADVCELYVRI